MNNEAKKLVTYSLTSNYTNPNSSHRFPYGRQCVEMTIDEIRDIILKGGLVQEILPNNELVTLNLSNYYTCNYTEPVKPVEEEVVKEEVKPVEEPEEITEIMENDPIFSLEQKIEEAKLEEDAKVEETEKTNKKRKR